MIQLLTTVAIFATTATIQDVNRASPALLHLENGLDKISFEYKDVLEFHLIKPNKRLMITLPVTIKGQLAIALNDFQERNLGQNINIFFCGEKISNFTPTELKRSNKNSKLSHTASIIITLPRNNDTTNIENILSKGKC